jgi:hypothetical protein
VELCIDKRASKDRQAQHAYILRAKEAEFVVAPSGTKVVGGSSVNSIIDDMVAASSVEELAASVGQFLIRHYLHPKCSALRSS